MPILDNLSGFEFEDIMEDVFRNLGYVNVRQSAKTGDEGRDVLMEEVVNETRRGIVVECKHTDSVGRPVIQKLHSAVATFDYDGPKRGMVVTTGRYTEPAREYAERLQRNNDPYPIELIDGTDLREIADDIGLDLYNGRIEILCDETLRPFDPANGIASPLREAFRDVANFDPAELSDPYAMLQLRPVLSITAETNAVFETSVGVIHQINETNTLVVNADRTRPTIIDSSVSSLVTNNIRQTINVDEGQFGAQFDEFEVERFGQTETEYKDWAVGQLQDYHMTTVTYTGDNNVTYNKTCKPNQSDISVGSITPVYLPRVRLTASIGEYNYPYKHFAAGPSRVTIEDGVHRCVHCDAEGMNHSYTYCQNCGSISCSSHTKTERLEGTPVCTGCAITKRFAFKTKYFYDEDNLKEFGQEYQQMPIHERSMENKPLVAGVLTIIMLVSIMFLSTGVI